MNDCRLVINGDISSWIYTDQTQGIAPGEGVEFVFDMNVPEEINNGEYFGDIKVSCTEVSKSQEVVVVIPSGLQSIDVRDIKHEGNILNISYVFDSSNVVGESTSVEIWLIDSEDIEVGRFIDSFSLNKQFIERNVMFEFSSDIAGVYSVYFALSSDSDNYVKQSVVLGKGSVTGDVVLDGGKGRIVGYVVFVLMLILIIIFMIYYTKKSSKKSHHSHKSKNKWLLRKKGWFH